jgi:ATP-binding cassette subfamily F protein uup
VLRATDAAFGYNGKPVVRSITTQVMRGDKIGVIGPNGAGKSTLLRGLLGDLPPLAGAVRHGTNLQIAYFDQTREQLDPNATAEDNVGEGKSSITVGGKTKHIIGYLRDFLFTPEEARSPIRFFSGGQRNRLLLARLFARPANLLVLDEPTNDLDSETLELLEQRLVDYEGTVLLVSHDREFLNNVVTSTLVLDGDTVREYVGGYDDWLRQRGPQADEQSAPTKPKASQKLAPSAEDRGDQRPKKLTYKDQRELEQLPALIEKLEAAQAALHEEMATPEFYKLPGDRIAAKQQELKALDERHATAFARWEELEGRLA